MAAAPLPLPPSLLDRAGAARTRVLVSFSSHAVPIPPSAVLSIRADVVLTHDHPSSSLPTVWIPHLAALVGRADAVLTHDYPSSSLPTVWIPHLAALVGRACAVGNLSTYYISAINGVINFTRSWSGTALKWRNTRMWIHAAMWSCLSASCTEKLCFLSSYITSWYSFHMLPVPELSQT